MFSAQAIAETDPVDLIEPISVSIKDIPELVGQSKNQVQLYAFSHKKLSPIPFQLDQVDENGLVYLDVQIEEKVKIPDQLSPRDLLFWMASDMGGQAPPKLLAAQKKAGKWLEISMARKTGKPQWAYLLLTPAISSSASVQDYVTFDLPDNIITTPYYYIGFKDPMFEDRFSWRTPDGSLGKNLLSQIAVRFRSRVLLGLIPLEVTEKDLMNTLIGFKDGQIRVIKRIRTIPRMPFGLSGPSTTSDYFFYRNSYETNVKVSFPRGGKLLIAASSFRIMLDFSPRKEDLTLNLAQNKVFRIHGNLSPGPHPIQQDSPTWVHFSGPGIPASFVTYLKLPDTDPVTFLPKDLFYMPNEKTSEGEYSGFLGSDIQVNPKRGDHTFSMNLYTIPASPEKVPPAAMLAAIENTFRDPYQIKKISPIAP